MVAIETMLGNQTILNCHLPRLPCHPAAPWGCVDVVPPWGRGEAVLQIGPLKKIVIKHVCVGKEKSKNKSYVDYNLNYAPPTSTEVLLPLRYITFVSFHCIQHFCTWFCQWPIAATLVRAPASCATPRPSHGRLRHSPCRPQPPMPGSGWALPGRSSPRGGRTPAAARPWLATPW
jgi:hypothetical protein